MMRMMRMMWMMRMMRMMHDVGDVDDVDVEFVYNADEMPIIEVPLMLSSLVIV